MKTLNEAVKSLTEVYKDFSQYIYDDLKERYWDLPDMASSEFKENESLINFKESIEVIKKYKDKERKYSGVEDKNKRDIFHSDRVIYKECFMGEIIYKRGSFCVELDDDIIPLYDINSDCIEVIPNEAF